MLTKIKDTIDPYIGTAKDWAVARCKEPSTFGSAGAVAACLTLAHVPPDRQANYLLICAGVSSLGVAMAEKGKKP